MSHRSFVEKKRKVFSWLLAIALGFVVLFSRSAWEEQFLISDLFFVTGIVLVGAAMAGRLWCSLYLCGYKTDTLVIVGPYSVCRNPLYFFSLLGGIGIGLTTETLIITLIIVVSFALYYPLVIRAEEKKLQKLHGEDYERYAAKTPRFWPSSANLYEPQEYTVKPRIFRKQILDSLWFVWIVGILELVEALHEYNLIPCVFKLY